MCICQALIGLAKVCTKFLGHAVSPMRPPLPITKTLLPNSELMVIVEISYLHFISFPSVGEVELVDR